MMKNNNDIKYAGFFTRLLVTLVDIAVVSFVVNIVGSVITLNAFVVLGIWWLYVSIMQIRWHTTIGGKLFGIEVLRSDDMEPLSFKWASVRFFVSIAPFFLYVYLRGMQHIMDMPPSPTMSQLPQLIFMLLPLVMFFTKKKQMIHDFVARSVVIDVNVQMNTEKVKQNKTVYVGQKILRVAGTLVFLTIFGYLLIYISVFYKLGKSSSDRYNASFSTQYKTNDRNDSKIIFYNKELEQYSEDFIKATSMYDIFEADVKKDLALNCIQSSLKEHNVSEWIEMGSNFRKNARNLYAKTENKIIKAKKNSNYMGEHFYDYDLNDVNEIEDEIADIWGDKDANIDTCQKLLSVNDMYKIFIKKYIYNREEILKRYKEDLRKAKPFGTLDKNFYKKKIKKTTAWITLLYKNNPSYNGVEYDFNLHLSSSDVSTVSNDLFIVADRNRGIELWKKSGRAIKYAKTLIKNYKTYRVKIIEDKIYAFVENDKRDKYLISCQFNEERESAFEISKIKVAASSMIRDWAFFDDNRKVAMVFGYSGMRTYDISSPHDIKLIQKRIERGTNSSLDIDMNIKNKTVYELRSRELGFYDFSGNKKSSDKGLKRYNALGVDNDKEIIYILDIASKTYTLYKYNNNFILLNSKDINIDLGGYNILGSRYPTNMKIYKSKIYIANMNVIYVFDGELKLINKFKVSSLIDFYLNKNKIILLQTDGTIKLIDLTDD